MSRLVLDPALSRLPLLALVLTACSGGLRFGVDDPFPEKLSELDLDGARWRTLRLDRAEPRQAGLLRPEGAFLGGVPGVANALVAWPTKLALGPALGEAIERRLQQDRVGPQHQPRLDPLAGLGRPALAASYWERLFQ